MQVTKTPSNLTQARPACNRSVKLDSGSCLIGAMAGLPPKSNLPTGALVDTGAGWSMPGMRMLPVEGARASGGGTVGATGAGAAARGVTGASMPGMRNGVGAVVTDGAEGADGAAEVAKSVKFSTDKAQLDRVNRIGQRLATAANSGPYVAQYGNEKTYPFTWRFFVIKDHDVNAF